MIETWLCLRPLDVVICRDGRSFSAGAGTIARTTLPRPTTTGGAAKAVWGREPKALAGPVLARLHDGTSGARLLFPAPGDLVFDEADGEVRRLRVGIGSEGSAQVRTDIQLPALPEGHGDLVDLWLTDDQLTAYLEGRDDPLLEHLTDEVRRPSAQLMLERRVGLYRAQGRTAEEGFLYAADHLRPVVDDLAFACRVSFDDQSVPQPLRQTVALGGRGRAAEVALVDSGDVQTPGRPEQFPGGRLLLYLATPAVFAEGWRPPVDGADLVSACVFGPDVVASWSTDRGRPVGQRTLRWAVAAGSVYHLRFDPPKLATDFAADYHGQCLPQAEDRLATAGFGLCFTGSWE